MASTCECQDLTEPGIRPTTGVPAWFNRIVANERAAAIGGPAGGCREVAAAGGADVGDSSALRRLVLASISRGSSFPPGQAGAPPPGEFDSMAQEWGGAEEEAASYASLAPQ